MSYILDALRRADAERERGAVPSLQSQQFALLPGEGDAYERPRTLLWVIAGLAAALLAALAWNFFGRAAPVAAAPVPVVTAAAPPPVATPARPAPAVVAGLPGTSSPPVPPAAIAAAVPLPPAGTIRPTRRARNDAPPARLAPPSGATAADRSPGASAAGARGRDGAGDARIYAQRDLPEDIRRALPNVTVSGSTYSSDSANRMLMINGQIFHEGDPVTSGLVLQQIRRRAAVFAFRGYRYELAF